jgi:prepilin-type N-terminal cleavage/methylation domain-containing protein
MTHHGGRPFLGTTRRGFTLIELLAVMTGVAVVLGLCAVTIQVLFRVSSDVQARRSASAALGRLAEQFREDVHAGDDVQLRLAAGLRLSRGPRVAIIYEAREGRVDRVESFDGTVSRRESYVLGRGSTAAFERRDDGPRRFLALVVRRTARAGQPDPPHPLEILAQAGKDRPEPPRTKGAPAR